MSSLAALQARFYNRKGVVNQQVDDTPVAIRLKYIGTGSVTSVTVTTATNIVMITSDGGTDTYAFATYTTMASLAAAINKDGIFEARVLDLLGSDATASTLVDGAITIGTLGYYDVLSDTSEADLISACLTWDRGTPTGGAQPALAQLHRVSIQSVVYNVTLGGGADTNALKIYERVKSNTGAVLAENLIFQGTPTSGSLTTLSWASGVGYLTAGDGNDLVARIVDATSVTGAIAPTGWVE